MVDPSAIAALRSSLRTAADMARAAVELRDDQKIISDTVNDLQREIDSALASAISAQIDVTDLIEKVRDLEAEVSKLKAWEAERQRYELCERVPGVFAYRLKDGAQPPEPAHYICETCFRQGTASILQRKTQGSFEMQLCPRCKTEIRIATIRSSASSVASCLLRSEGW